MMWLLLRRLGDLFWGVGLMYREKRRDVGRMRMGLSGLVLLDIPLLMLPLQL